MFYAVKLKDHIRVPPIDFDKELDVAVISQVKEKYSGYVSGFLNFLCSSKSFSVNSPTSFFTKKFKALFTECWLIRLILIIV